MTLFSDAKLNEVVDRLITILSIFSSKDEPELR
jgi:hypothetical protein